MGFNDDEDGCLKREEDRCVLRNFSGELVDHSTSRMMEEEEEEEEEAVYPPRIKSKEEEEEEGEEEEEKGATGRVR